MDYGQQVQDDNLERFPTSSLAGEGDISGAENLSENPQSWDVKTERDPRSIGENVLKFPEQLGPDNSPEAQDPQALGQVINLEMPPGVEASVDTKAGNPIEASLNPQLTEVKIKTTNRLTPESVKAIDESVEKFEQDGKVADFYSSVRDRMEENLDNSYGRKLAT